jgi:cytosine/adenosine deaminase-related metal-dependent hydrolase
VAHAPLSNAKSGRAICPAWRMMNAGIRVGLATDGPLSGNGMDIQGVLSLFPKLQNTREENREILTAREALRTATLGGAEVLLLEAKIGSLETGKKADFILIDSDDFNIQPIYDIYATLVYALKPHNVRHVYVNGHPLAEDRKIVSFDADKARVEMKKIRDTCKGYIGKINSCRK